MTERQAKIIEIVNEHKKIEVNFLSKLLKVSQVTVRKDLDVLAEKGLLAREHGYASVKDTYDINVRMPIRYEVKMRIAKAAAKMVAEGETVMIESGSTCALLAEELARRKQGITILTNSAFIAEFVKEMEGSKVILLGGEYQKNAQVMVGPLVRICAREFHVDKFFVGTDGFDRAYGVTGNDMLRSEAIRSMAESARKVIVVTDADKFQKQGVVMELRFEEIYGLITDEGIPKDIQELLEEQKIQVTVVS